MGQSDLPLARGARHVATFERFGWEQRRTSGSHVMMTKDGQKATLSVPCKKGKDLPRGTLAKLIEAANISESDYLAKFKK